RRARTYNLFAEENSADAVTEKVQYLTYSVTLLFRPPESDLPDGCEAIKIAEVVRTSIGARRVEEYIPPLVVLGASPELVAKIDSVKNDLEIKGRELKAAGYQGGKNLEDFQVQDIGPFLIQQTLNRYIPLFHQYVKIAEHVHPLPVYISLCQLVGELSGFS